MASTDFESSLKDTDEIQLITTGRQSGRESSRPVWFVQQSESVYLLPVTGSDSNWFKNVVKTPAIRLAAGGVEHSAEATPITDAAKVDEVVDAFRAKYGDQAVESYYPKHDVAVEVPAG